MEINLDYPVYIGNSYLKDLNIILEDYEDQYSRLYIIVDENTHALCLPQLLNDVEMLEGAQVMEIPSGEDSKTLEIVQHLWTTLSEDQADRKTLIVNLGGGVVTDLGGFTCSTYKRGIRFIQIPTTLLSQVDASVGSKVGVNFGGYKNQIGAFTDPMMVIIAPMFLDTLKTRDLLSGFAEVMKHALIADLDYWNYLKNQDAMDWPKIIERSVEIKAEIVKNDPKEQGKRKILNFGHTFAHAFESYSAEINNHILHGEAVAFGMICEGFLSVKYLGLHEDALHELTEAILSIYSIDEFEFICNDTCLNYCSQDKKNEGDKLLLSLLTRIGECKENVEVSPEDLKEALSYLKQQVNV